MVVVVVASVGFVSAGFSSAGFLLLLPLRKLLNFDLRRSTAFGAADG